MEEKFVPLIASISPSASIRASCDLLVISPKRAKTENISIMLAKTTLRMQTDTRSSVKEKACRRGSLGMTQTLSSKQHPDTGKQFIFIKRFGDVIIRACFDTG